MMVQGPLRGHLTMRVGNPALPYCGPRASTASPSGRIPSPVAFGDTLSLWERVRAAQTQPTAFSSFHSGKSFGSSSSIPAKRPSFSRK